MTDLQQTPVSVSAVTAEDIDRLVARDISGIATSVPGFSASRITAFNAASFAMRGVGLTDIIVYQDSPVGVTIDDFVTAERADAVARHVRHRARRSPARPAGHAVRQEHHRRPRQRHDQEAELAESGAELRALYGSFEHYQLQGALNVPLGDTFALRGAVSYNKSDGYYENRRHVRPDHCLRSGLRRIAGSGRRQVGRR